MLELGHPMHAHDRNRITGGLAVRFARPGETVVTLDDIERRLEPTDVLIVDEVATAAIGGVMGAASTEVRADSTDVLLEAAVWDAAAVSRTQRRLHLPSEAARRYERTVDPAISVAALDRCATLLADIAGGAVSGTLTDWRGDPPRDDWSLPRIRITVDLPDRVAGVAYAAGATARRLTQIGAVVAENDDILMVTPPSWRPDLLQPADLVEEVLRLEGLEVVPSVLPLAPAGTGLTPAQKRRRAIGKALAQSGYVEILPTPFLPAGVFDLWGLPAADPRRATTQVLNPLEASSTSPCMPSRRWCGRPSRLAVSGSSLSTADRPMPRSPCWTRPCPGNRSTSPRCWPGCVNREAHGVPAAEPKPPTLSRRCGSSRGPAGST
jgi:phenylalanyl-tRNA synthetase beta chain